MYIDDLVECDTQQPMLGCNRMPRDDVLISFESINFIIMIIGDIVNDKRKSKRAPRTRP